MLATESHSYNNNYIGGIIYKYIYYNHIFVAVIVFLAALVMPVVAAGVLICFKVKERYMRKQE